MDLGIYCVLLLRMFAELFLLTASASEDYTPVEEEHKAQLPPFYFVDEQTDIVIPLHTPIAIQCPVVSSGGDQISITWRKDGSSIVNTTTRWILPNGTLYLEAGEPQMEEGFYVCLANHSIGTIASGRIRLEAPIVPEFVQHPQDLVAFQGESVRLECIANGTPKAVISWVKNGRPLDVNQTWMNTFSGVLQIINTTPLDNGTYECLATNTAGQQRSGTAKVTIHSSNATESLSPKLLGGPLDQIAVVFDKVVLECFLTGRPRPTVSWMKQGGAMFSSVGRVQVTRHGNLEISSVQLLDAGTYICSWLDTESSETTTYRLTRLTVLAPPQLVHDRAMMDLYTALRRGKNVRLRCEFEGMPLPRVVWLKNGQLLEPSERIQMNEWELVIGSGDTSDSGFYQCRGENIMGAFQSTTWLETKSENTPLPPVELVVIPLTSTSVKLSWTDNPLNENHSIMAYCLNAFPTRGGFEHQRVHKKDEGSEMIWDVFQPFTNYTFYIVAYNVDGGSDHSAYVTAMTLEDVPIESPLMEVTPVGPTGLRLHWSELGPDLARGVILQYRVLHRHRGNSSYQQNLVNADIREFVIQGLRSETEYEIVVLAGTVKGFPMLDSVSWVTVTTKAAKNTEVPACTEMNISMVSSNSIVVSWMMDNALQLVRFRLTYRRINQKHYRMPTDDVIRIVSLDKDANRYIFTELESYAVYQVTLSSQNQFGWSDSVTKTFRTDAGVNNGEAKSSRVDVSEVDLPDPPTMIFAEAINRSAIRIRWERPADINDITRYTIRYCPELKDTVSDISVVKFVTSPVERVVIGDLNAHTEYDLSVQTHTNNAIGPFSSVVKCRTEEGMPSVPINIQLTVYSDTAIQIIWDPPVQTNGVIIHYNIFYTTDHTNALSDWFKKTSSGTSLSSIVSHLKPSTIYYFRLQAATFAENSPLSDIVHIRTQDPNDLNYHDAAYPQTSSILSDQDLGIIIGSAIGITCIILCVIFIVIRDRRRTHHAAPVTRPHMANGAVKSCRCHLANNGSEAEPWRVAVSDDDDDDDFPSVNSVLVENENCDTKGGYTQSERQGRVPVRAAVARSGMCNGIEHSERQPNQLAVKASSSAGNEKAESSVVAESEAGNSGGKLPSKQLSSRMPSDQIESCPLADSDTANVEPVDTSSNGNKEENEPEDALPVGHFNEEEGAYELESLMSKGRPMKHCHEMPVGESTSCAKEDQSRETTEEEKRSG